jgi:hypothetical protein
LDFLTDNAFGLFILIAAPGFLSLKIWSLIQPSQRISFVDSLYEAIFFGCINYFAVVIWFPPFLTELNQFLYIPSYIISLLLVPIVLPIIWQKILNSACLKGKIINLTPKGWDYFFRKSVPCFMLIHLKNGQVIGGLYHTDSLASSYPEKEDIYLQEIWELDDIGKFKNPIDKTMGLLINYESVDYIELFKITE